MSLPCSWTLTPLCADWDNHPQPTKDAATQYATLVLWAATGRQYGLCPITVRPCGRRTDGAALWGYIADGGTWIPYLDSVGTWRNCSCGASACGCAPRCEVWLPGPVDSVTQVLQDGVVVNPTAYVVDDRRWLVRVDGGCWPEHVDLSTDTSRFEVTYVRGTAVPPALLNAAGTLACEFAKSLSNQECRLPARMSSLARQGVQVSMLDTDSLVRRNMTGIPEVDQVIFALNPHGLFSRPRVFTPDVQQPRIRRA